MAETELEVRTRLEYLRQACRELLHLPPDAPDEDIIDTLREVLTVRQHVIGDA